MTSTAIKVDVIHPSHPSMESDDELQVIASVSLFLLYRYSLILNTVAIFYLEN